MKCSPLLLFLMLAICAQAQVPVVDTAITGFRFAVDFQGMKVYTKNGKSDLSTLNPTAFSVTTMPNATYENAKDQLEMLVMMSLQGGYTQSEPIRKDTTINGNRAFYISYTETQKGTNYENRVFNGFHLQGNSALIFVSGDLDKGKYVEAFRRTFFTARF